MRLSLFIVVFQCIALIKEFSQCSTHRVILSDFISEFGVLDSFSRKTNGSGPAFPITQMRVLFEKSHSLQLIVRDYGAGIQRHRICS